MKYNKFRDIPRYIRANYQVDYPLSYFEKWLKEEEEEAGLQLNPDFQRGHVWTEAQQIAYIEFLLRGGKTGRDLYFNCPEFHHKNEVSNYTDYVCVDGLQRITAILRFLHRSETRLLSDVCCTKQHWVRVLHSPPYGAVSIVGDCSGL